VLAMKRTGSSAALDSRVILLAGRFSVTFLAKRFVLLLLLMCLVAVSCPIVFAQDSYQTAKVLSVRQIRHSPGLNPSRFSGPVYFTIDFALQISANSYCVDYETPILDEVQDLRSANGKEVKIEMRGKKLAVVLPTGRKIKAELVKQTQC
jgi:hypothetical protein